MSNLFPGALNTDASLLLAANNVSATLGASLTNSTAPNQTITIAEGTTNFPTAGAAFIRGVEIVTWSGKTSSTLTGVTRAQEGTAAVAHPASASVQMIITAAYHNIVVDVIKAHEPRILSSVDTNAPRLVNAAQTPHTMTNPRDLFIQGNIAYVANSGGSTIEIYDISEPANLSLIKSLTDADLNFPRGLVVQGKYLYVANQMGGGSLVVFDVSNPKSPVKIVTRTGGSITSIGGIGIQGRYLYVNDATGKHIIFDVADPANPIELGNVIPFSGATPGKFYVRGRYVYLPVQSNGGDHSTDGLYVIDVSNPAAPTVAGTAIVGAGFAPVDCDVIDKTVYMANEGGGFHIISVKDPANPVILASVTSGGISGRGSTGIAARGRFVYLDCLDDAFINVYDVLDPNNVTVVATIDDANLNVPARLVVDGRYLYVVNRGISTDLPPDSGSMSIIDIGQGYVTQIHAGAIKTHTLSVVEQIKASRGDFFDSLSAGGSASIGGDVAIGGKLNLKGALSLATPIGDASISSSANWNSKQPGDSTLTALAAFNSNGLITQTALDTFTARTIQGTTNRVSVTNGNGVAANPAIDIDAAYIGQASITTVGVIGTGSWNATAIAWAKVDKSGSSLADLTTRNAADLSSGTLPDARLSTNVILIDGSRAFTSSISGIDPTIGTHLATKNYVDAAITGFDVKASVRIATTANITLSGTQTIDGVAVIAGDRVLVKDQGTASQNGIYVVASGSWTRATDADTSTEVTSGMFCFVNEGTANDNTGWVLTTADPIVLGTTALSFTQFTGLGEVTAGTGLSKSGNTISIDAAYVGQTSITTVGTIGTGTWNATTISVLKGGTGLTSFNQGDLVYASASNTLAALAKDTNATRYLSNTGASNAPAWAQINLSNGVTNQLGAANGGTGITTAASTGIPSIAAGTWSVISTTGTGNAVLATSPTLVTPVLGAATATSIGLGSAGVFTWNSADTGLARIAAKVVGATSGSTTADGWFVEAGFARVTTQFDKTNTTLADITGMSVPVIAGRTYVFQAILFVTLDATGIGKVAVAGTATATAISWDGYGCRGNGATLLGLGRTTALGTSQQLTTSVIQSVYIKGIITVNAGGTLTFQFAQGAGPSGTSSVLTNSIMWVKDTNT